MATSERAKLAHQRRLLFLTAAGGHHKGRGSITVPSGTHPLRDGRELMLLVTVFCDSFSKKSQFFSIYRYFFKKTIDKFLKSIIIY